jgi:hypothetical protein
MQALNVIAEWKFTGKEKQKDPILCVGVWKKHDG